MLFCHSKVRKHLHFDTMLNMNIDDKCLYTDYIKMCNYPQGNTNVNDYFQLNCKYFTKFPRNFLPFAGQECIHTRVPGPLFAYLLMRKTPI